MTFVSSSSLRETTLDVAVAVAPRAELLDDPRGEAGRRVVQRIAEGLRLRALNLLVSALVGHVGVALLHALQLRRRDAGVGIAAGRGAGETEIQVQSGDVRRVLDGRDAADDAAPVPALRP